MIEFHGLVKSHGKNRVLDSVSLSVGAGERAALIGPSGGGKTTLLRCALGLDTFEEGRIVVEGTCLTAEANDRTRLQALREIRRKAAVVFQQFHLFPHLSVMENVLCGLMYGLGRKREEAEPEARKVLVRVGLAEKLEEKPEQLSGGQQQRVAIARAMALKPRVLLLDEPTSALDPRNAREVVSVITDLARSGQTMLLVTHDVGFARRVADTVHVMDHGHVIESGSVRQVLDHPREEATRSFLGSVVNEG
jgi:ABC-type polar amino acid transport system ATPase subunit